MASYLVTGGAGFIGSHIVERLVKSGHSVKVIDDLSTGKMERIRPFKIEFIGGDIRNIETVRMAMEGVDYVIHTAAVRAVKRSIDNPSETDEVNVHGTLNVLLVAQERGVKRVVYTSSSSIYGECKKFPQKETFHPDPVSPYAVSKLAGEFYCRMFSKAFGLQTVSLRYFNVYGPRQDPESIYSAVIPRFMEQSLSGEPLEVHWDGKQSRDFTYISDVVDATLLACEVEDISGGVFNVACGKSRPILEIAIMLEEILGKKLELDFHPKRPGDVRKTLADISKARSILGFSPKVDFRTGLEHTLDYFKEIWK
jgi:UDP-glucose 4-epimerase